MRERITIILTWRCFHDKATGLGLIAQNQKNQNGLKKIFNQLATGKRINRASDDAAMLSIAKELEKQVRGFQVVENNVGDAMAALRIADGASSSISDMMQRQRELAIQASNGTLNQEQRNSLNQEFQALSSEIDRTAQAAQYNTQSLLNGDSPLSDGTGEIQVGTGTAEADQVNMPESDLTSENLAINNLDISNPANINAAISQLDTAMNQVNTTRTNQGALYNRFQSTQDNAANTRINTAAALSQAEDLDYAEGTAEQARQSILAQTNTMALRNFNEIARNNVMSLLGA
ncbi:flagellin [Fibrobacterota bacterium]